MPRPKKDPYDLLAEETKNNLAGASAAELNAKISAVAADAVAERQRMAADEALQAAKAEAKALAQPYKEALKACQQLIDYCVAELQGRGAV
jgi:hypothetical protein